MIIVECVQGTPEWHKARAGVITASMFAEVRRRINGLNEQQQRYVDAVLSGSSESEAVVAAGYKSAPKAEVVKRALNGEQVGDFTDVAKDYAFRLAVERISGDLLDEGGFSTYAMRRGQGLEPEARDAHSFECGIAVMPAGFVKTDDGKYGASADGLIGEDGGAEYKCLIDPARIREILLRRKIDEFLDQVQGGMWVTERKWWHFVLYCPALESIGKSTTVFEVERDDDYIRKLEADLREFDALVCKFEKALRSTNNLKEAA